MSRMLRKNDCVPAGTLAQLIAGDSPSPVATPGAAWLNFTGIAAVGKSADRQRHRRSRRRRRRAAPRCWASAATGIAMSTAIVETTNHIVLRMLFLQR